MSGFEKVAGNADGSGVGVFADGGTAALGSWGGRGGHCRLLEGCGGGMIERNQRKEGRKRGREEGMKREAKKDDEIFMREKKLKKRNSTIEICSLVRCHDKSISQSFF